MYCLLYNLLSLCYASTAAGSSCGYTYHLSYSNRHRCFYGESERSTMRLCKSWFIGLLPPGIGKDNRGSYCSSTRMIAGSGPFLRDNTINFPLRIVLVVGIIRNGLLYFCFQSWIVWNMSIYSISISTGSFTGVEDFSLLSVMYFATVHCTVVNFQTSSSGLFPSQILTGILNLAYWSEII